MFNCDDQMGRHIPDLTRMTFKGIELTYNKSFECPYCLTIQKVASHWEWKKHVFWDLQPYVCTVKDCVQATQLFDTREYWFHHVTKTHCRLWSCVFCSSELHSLADLKEHFNHSHAGKITDNQFPFIAGACERPKTEFDCHSCPFCDSWDPVVTQPDRSKAFFRHLARHLQQIALEALPLYIEGLEVKAVASLDKSSRRVRVGISQ
ncbi:hypothetical protein K456DRAFT_51233 [Colletotrichum gloeosporioides 23]|nr:hypothetical protein K456DRAFT_51233 [Colletotrichum gloeosporioides 23]